MIPCQSEDWRFDSHWQLGFSAKVGNCSEIAGIQLIEGVSEMGGMVSSNCGICRMSWGHFLPLVGSPLRGRWWVGSFVYIPSFVLTWTDQTWTTRYSNSGCDVVIINLVLAFLDILSSFIVVVACLQNGG